MDPVTSRWGTAYRIPPEIVVKIIRELLPENICDPPRIQDRISALLGATSICRYWRCAVLDDASLWSVVPAHLKNLGPLFLQRCPDARRSCSAHQATVSLLPYTQRIKRAELFASTQASDVVFSALDRYGTCLDEIGMFSFPSRQLQRFPYLSHLELWGAHDLPAVSYLLTSFPTLVSTIVNVESSWGHSDHLQLPDRIAPHPSLRRVHLQVGCYPLKVVLDSLKIQVGVHLQCDAAGCRHGRLTEKDVAFLPLPLEFFKNASEIEALTTNGLRRFKCSGSGASGSFCIEASSLMLDRQPLEGFLSLRNLVVADTIYQHILERYRGISISAHFADFRQMHGLRVFAGRPHSQGATHVRPWACRRSRVPDGDEQGAF